MASTLAASVAQSAQPVTFREEQRVWRAFSRDRLALVGAIVIAIEIAVTLFAPLLAPYNPIEQNVLARFVPPSLEHWLGTDQYGRDQLSRLVFGSRISLGVGLSSVLILIVIGVALGAIAGYRGGAVEMAIMGLVDVLMSMPRFFLILAIIALFGANMFNTVLVIGLTGWMGTARLVRGQILSLREQEFILAASSIGVPSWRMVLLHLLPNTLAPIIVQTTLFISYAILIETGLSYLGLGAQPPDPSWGNMLSGGKLYMARAWWLTVFPGLAIFATVLAFNLFGDGLRDAFDPRMRRE